LNTNVSRSSSFDVAEVDEGSPEPLAERLTGAKGQHTDAGDFVRLLRLEEDWRDKNGQGAGEKGPTLHHSPSLCRSTGIPAHFASSAAGARKAERCASGAAESWSVT
jgi:hypothetical protein